MSLAYRPTPPGELARVEDRVSFLYLEQCTIARDDNAVTASDENGTMYIPSAGLAVLMLGPGTRVTHAAMSVVADGGCAVVWVGERGVRYYASGRPLGRSTRLLERQARLVSNTHSRLAVARAMYSRRFPGEDVSALTMQQLRGREGARVRRIYRQWSQETGIEWTRRTYDPHDFADADPINQALSAANACLYGVVHGVVAALGLSPGLGFVHTGHDRSFVYDIADLYKAELAIPAAFEVVANWQFGDERMSRGNDLASTVRREMRDRILTSRLMERIVDDLIQLMSPEDPNLLVMSQEEDVSSLGLWDDRADVVAAGVNYFDPESLK